MGEKQKHVKWKLYPMCDERDWIEILKDCSSRWKDFVEKVNMKHYLEK